MVAEQGFAEVGGAALGRQYAELAAGMDKVEYAVSALRSVVDTEADLGAARDLAVLQRDRLDDADIARQTCLRGLAGSAFDDTTDGQDSDAYRLARYELITLYLRLCPLRELDDAMATVGADRLPLADRLLVQAFASGREEHGSEKAHAVRLFDEGLRRDPYHPGGLYDLACTLASYGHRQGAREALLAAIRDGDDRLADRFAHDRDLFGLDIPAADIRSAVRGTSHSLSAFQVRPAYENGGIRFRIRPGIRLQHAYDAGTQIDGVLRLDPDPLDPRSYTDAENRGLLEPLAEEYVLRPCGDRSYFRGWDLHCALRRLAPLVEDTHGFIYDWNVGGYLDEVAIVDGHLTFVRQYTGICDAPTRRDLLKERMRLAQSWDR